MSDLVRKQLYITQNQERILKMKAKELGVTEAEIVREALESAACQIKYPKKTAEKWQEEFSYINERIASRKTGQKQRTWKRVDLYDR
jgi:hypothetical protein